MTQLRFHKVPEKFEGVLGVMRKSRGSLAGHLILLKVSTKVPENLGGAIAGHL